MNRLQRTLQINAIFSGVSGIALVVFNQWFAHLFGTGNGTIFWVIGLGLLIFTGTIIYEIFKQRPTRVLVIIAQDFLWVLGSIILLVLQPYEISNAGNYTIALVALIVLLMGVNQSKALAQIDVGPQKGSKRFRFERIVKGTKQEVWKVIADIGNYHKVAPNIDDETIISGEGRGMVRRCSHGKDSWTETCSLWEAGKVYSFVINTSAPDYPYPFNSLKGTWEVEEMDADTTKIRMLFDFQYKRKFQNWVLYPLLKSKFTKIADELLDNWEYELKNK